MHQTIRLGKSVAVLALVVVVGAACTTSSNNGGTTTSGQNGGTNCSQPIKIGLLAPFSGIAASVGRNMGEGLNIAATELNAADGVLGCQIEIVQRDDQFDPAKDASGARELIDQEHVAAIIGPAGTTNWLAIRQIVDQAHVLDYPIVTDPTLKENVDPFTFRIMIPDDIEIKPLVDYAVKNYSKIAVIAEDDQTGHSQIKQVQQEMAAHGKKPVTVQQFDTNGLDYTPQVLQLKQSGATAVILGSHIGPYAARVLNAAASIGYHPQWLGLAGMTTYTVADLAQQNVVGMIFVAPANPIVSGQGVSPNERKFLAEYRKCCFPDGIRSESGANKMIGAAFLTYDGLKMWAQAAEKAKSYSPDDVANVFNSGYQFGPQDSSASLTWSYTKTDHEGFHATDAWFYRWVKDANGIEYKFLGDANKLSGNG
jgi:branched-chain amino acid transport system substrate-binding protein